MKKIVLPLVICLLAAVGFSSPSQAQQTSYKQTNLVANIPGMANHTDPQLSNSWGIASFPGQPFWIADNNSGLSTLYDASGSKNSLVVQIPSAKVNPCNPGCPTGIVANGSPDFGGALFLFDTEDGILVSWSGGTQAQTAFDNSVSGAVYKGLALASNNSGNFLLAANFRSGKIDVFDRNLNLTSLAGSFNDPSLPAGFAPHGVHVINNQVYVAYALQDAPKHDPVNGPGNGFVDVFDVNGNFVRRLASMGSLNSPWGVAMASATFGSFSRDILVGNFGDGSISAFDSGSGKFLGSLTDAGKNVLRNPGLWDLAFGQTSNDANTLYLTAGGANQTSGLFATLVPAQAATSGDFSFVVSSPTITLTPGGSNTLTVSSGALGGFNSPIALSCSGLPAGVSCSFSPSSITPGSSTAMSNLRISVSSGYTPAALMTWLPLSGAGLLGLVFGSCGTQGKSARRILKRNLGVGAVVLLGMLMLVAAGCGMSSSQHTNNGATSFMVTGTSGSITHSVPVMLTIH